MWPERTARRFAPAVLGLLDRTRPKAREEKRDELTYTSNKGRDAIRKSLNISDD